MHTGWEAYDTVHSGWTKRTPEWAKARVRLDKKHNRVSSVLGKHVTEVGYCCGCVTGSIPNHLRGS